MTGEQHPNDPEARASNRQPPCGSAIGIAGQAEHVDFDATRRFLTARTTVRHLDTSPTVPAELGD